VKKIYRFVLNTSMVLAILLEPLFTTIPPVLAQGSSCTNSSPSSGAYTVTLCLTDPSGGSALAGNVTVTASISIFGASPGVQRIIFYLDGEYLLTDYQSPYTFTLPTTKWIDGNYSLSVESLLRDGFVAQQAIIPVSFNNNITTPPVNTNQFQPTSGNPANGGPFVVASAGDGAGGETSAALVANLAASYNPNLFLYLGDVYEKGTITEFYNWYGSGTNNFSQLNPITNPTIGNHEYENGAAPGYFDYWDNVPNYYSYDAGGWHFVSLNSNSAFEPTDPQSAQYQWLQQDLAANAGACTIVYYHHPLFNIGPEGAKTTMSDIWALMAQYQVTIALTGHDHNYQRWVPLDGNGQPSPTGITEFVNGAGGHGVRPFVTSDSRVAYSNDTVPDALGVLFLQLNTNGASFSYVNTAGNVLDAGAIPCIPAGPDTQAPSAPENLTATAVSATQVNLTWSAASDDTGVSGYTVYRDGTEIASLSSSNLFYSDKSAFPNTTYTYTVDAFDPAENHSAASNPATETTLSMPPSLTFLTEADTYVNESNPNATYGSATVLRADASPDLHSFLRFTVEGLAGLPIEQARLLIYANNSSTVGINIYAVADNTWSEATTSYNNAPSLGATLASSGVFTSGSWIELDVTSYVTGEGTYSFGLNTPGTASLSFPSRELGTNTAQLIINLPGSGPDTEPPSTPDGLTANVIGPSTVDLAWNSSIDNVAVTGYTIYRDGTAIDTVPDTSLMYTDSTAAPETSYQYTVDAFDADGNHSAESAAVSVTTPNIPSSLTFVPLMDAYVNAGNPGSNYGHSSSLRVDGTPDVWSYLRFDVEGTGGAPISRARLLIYANSDSYYSGIVVNEVTDNTWDEYTITYNNAPALGSEIASAPSVLANTWLEFDVTSYVTAEGVLNFGLSTPGPTAIGLASRESGANSPQLIVDFLSGGPDTQSPNIPTGLTANASGSAQVDLNWDASSDNVAVTGYTVYRDGVEIGTVSDTVLSYSDTTVSPSITYQYSVDAFDAAGNHSAASAPVSVTTPNNPPTVPAGLAADVISSARVDLSWEASTDDVAVDGYTLYRDGSVLAVLSAAELSYSDTSVLSGVSYSYTVDAFDVDGNHSAMSAPVVANTPDTEPPSVPSGLTANAASSTQVNLNWSASGDNVAVAGYTVYRDGSVLATVSGSSLAYSDTTAAPATTYQYSLDAFDAAGNHSAATAPVSASTPDVPASLTFTPQADAYVNGGNPNGNYGHSQALRADGSPDVHSYMRFDVQGTGGAQVSRARLFIYVNSSSTDGLDVEAVADNSWGEYTVDYNNGPALGSVLASSPPVIGGNWYAFDVTPYVTGNGLLSFGVSTVGPTAISLASRESGANSPQLVIDLASGGPDTQAPAVPTGLVANASGATQVDLSWNASTDNVGVTGYTVYRDGIAIATLTSSNLSYSNSPVSPATSYQYSVDAFDAAGNHSAASAPVTVTTPDNPPTVPTGLTANAVSATQVDLSWNASTDDQAVVGYTLYRDGTQLTTLAGLSYSDTSVAPGVTYSYTVDAYDTSGNHSAASAPVNVTTPTAPDSEAPSMPTGLAANASGATQVDLSWNASTDNVAVTGYTIYRDGSALTTVAGATLSYSDQSAAAATTYQYSIDAFDAAGNHSAESGAVVVSTPDIPSSLTFDAQADAYVHESHPTSNYGSSNSLRVDALPDERSYLRFDVQGLGGSSIVQARLLIFVNTSASQGLDLWAINDNSWDENTINYANAPTIGGLLASSGSIISGSWVEFDVTSFVTGEGAFSFSITDPSTPAVRMSSRESNSNTPQLILDLQ